MKVNCWPIEEVIRGLTKFHYSEPKLNFIFIVLVYTLGKESFKCLSHIVRCISTRLEVLVISLGTPSLHITWVHLPARQVTLVAAHDDFCPVHLDTESTHLFLPVDQ